MKPALVALTGAEGIAARLSGGLGVDVLPLESRRFPDGETYLRLLADPAGKDVAVVAALRHPDPQIPALLFAADMLRDLGANSVGLIAPYLPYMRQDARFQAGEAVTSRSFARLVSAAYDWLVTVEPHLHRHASLSELYTVPASAVPSAPAIARWLAAQHLHPVVVGPDAESEPWVQAVAQHLGCPHLVLRKRRRGDRKVELILPRELPAGRTPVVIDDIVASGATMVEAVKALRLAGYASPWCIGVHALFDEAAPLSLQHAGASAIATCNTLPHATNEIDVMPELIQAALAIAVSKAPIHPASPAGDSVR